MILQVHNETISIHALREEGDLFNMTTVDLAGHFYPRPPRGGRLVMAEKMGRPLSISIHALREEGDVARTVESFRTIFLSTPSARRATAKCGFLVRKIGISIHALREEGDHLRVLQAQDQTISIHALREEGDHLAPTETPKKAAFLSTPSARRATSNAQKRTATKKHFYPRPPRGGRPAAMGLSDAAKEFLSTPSARRAT